MTNAFSNLKNEMEDSVEAVAIMKNIDNTHISFICLYQIATSLIDIEKDLRRIEDQMKKRKV